MDSIYSELSKKLMMEHSRILPKLWELICSAEEAEVVNLLPGTAEELAIRSGRTQEDMDKILASLFHKGAAFEAVKDGKIVYRMPRHIVQFHDSTILWKEAPHEMMDLWVEFMDSEYPGLLELLTEAKLPAFMRVIPINESLEPRSQVLVYEDAARLIEGAQNIAVVECVCRKSHKKCDAPLEVCIQLNRGADYTLKRGTGRKIDRSEALDILKKSEDAGLVHMTENRSGYGNVLCNCCDCCCEMLRFMKNSRTRGVVAPSRYLALVDGEACTSCGSCVDACPVGAITMDNGGSARAGELCIGCGLCAHACPASAITLRQNRPESFIPA